MTPPKILCLTSHDLNAPDYGAALRARNIFQLLARVGQVRVALAGHYENAVENAKSPQAGFELLEKFYFQPVQFSIADRVRHQFDPRFLIIEGRRAAPRDRERMENLIAENDLIWIHSLQIANAFDIWRWPKTVLDIDDIPSDYHRLHLGRLRKPLQRFRARREMLLWRRQENHLAKRFDAICVCSESDRQKLPGAERIFVLPNGFAAPEKMPSRNPAAPPQIGFVGLFKYPPNRDGIRWFVENVWPLILKKFPLARLRLAGEGGELFQNFQNVDAPGWVADMENEMANWSLAIVPVLVGGGTRIKIIEAFSRKCPVVSTRLGAYGYDVENGRELFFAESPKDFAANCLHILTNPSAGEKLAENGWQKFLANWTWDSQADRVAEIAGTILRKPASHSVCSKMVFAS